MSESFPLAGRLVDGRAAFAWLLASVPVARQPVDLCSAFLRSEALQLLVKELPPGLGGRILVRWRLGDFLAGASNLAAYEVADSVGLALYMRLSFHGKAYVVPPVGILVGSANMTLSGLGIAAASNDEICTVAHFDGANQAAIDTQFEGATRVTPKLREDLEHALGLAQSDPNGLQDWPRSVLEQLLIPRKADRLFVDECLWSSSAALLEGREPRSVAETHDYQLLALPASLISSGSVLPLARSRFRESTMYRWLQAAVRRRSGEAYFGELSAALHDALLDDPAPTRQGVKELLQNLLSWIELVGVPEIVVDRPRHSQRVRIAM